MLCTLLNTETKKFQLVQNEHNKAFKPIKIDAKNFNWMNPKLQKSSSSNSLNLEQKFQKTPLAGLEYQCEFNTWGIRVS